MSLKSQIIDKLEIGKGYHLFYKDENTTITRSRRVIVLKINTNLFGSGKELIAITPSELNNFSVDEWEPNTNKRTRLYYLDREIASLDYDDTGEVGIGDVLYSKKPHGNIFRRVIFMEVLINNEYIKLQIPSSTFQYMMSRVSKLEDNLAECLGIGKSHHNTTNRLLYVWTADSKKETITFECLHGKACETQKTRITWTEADSDDLYDENIVLFEDLSDPISENPVVEEKTKKLSFFQFLFGWIFKK